MNYEVVITCAVTGAGALEAIVTGEEAEPASFLDDRSLLHIAGSSGFAGTYQGSAAIRALFGHLAYLSRGTLRIDRTRILAESDRVLVVQWRLRAERSSTTLDTDLLAVATIETGTLTEAWLFHSDQPEVDAFWSML